jgi:uncharacterized membrane protein HdeD (DUF308 family)
MERDTVSQSIRTSATGAPYDERASLGRTWLFLALGLVSVFVGFLAIGSAFIATLASVPARFKRSQLALL